MDLVSVIVPVYNVEKYLAKCIDSILAQTYQNIEIILVDDGSTDESSIICDLYAKKDVRIKVIHKKNGGASDARNYGLKSIKGNFFCFIDADDYIARDMIENLYRYIIKENADMALCDFLYVDEQGVEIEGKNKNSPIRNEILTKRQALSKLEQENNWYYVSPCNRLYKRQIFCDLQFPVGKYYEDEYIIHHIFESCNRIVSTDKKLYFYVQRGDSTTHLNGSREYQDAVDALYDRMFFSVEHYYDTLLIATLNQCITMQIKNKNNVEVEMYITTKKTIRKYIRKYMKIVFSSNGPFAQKIRLFLYSICPSMIDLIHHMREN